MPRYIVMTSSAKMPSKVRAPYRNVAVVETDGVHMPKYINPRHKTVVRIVARWERQHCGHRPRGNTAFERAYREACALAVTLNSEC